MLPRQKYTEMTKILSNGVDKYMRN